MPQLNNKKGKQTLGGAILGTFIGIALIVGSPYVLWQAETQHRAKDFSAAIQVENTEVMDGYVTFEGTPSLAEGESPLKCADAEDCYYYSLRHEQLEIFEEEQCGSTDGVILYQTGQQCDSDGNCETCYMVEKEEWRMTSSETDFQMVNVGEYQVEMNNNSEMVGTKEKTIMLSDTLRDVWRYFPTVERLRVAGESRQGLVQGAGELTYVLSAYSYDQTLSELESRDATNKWIFRAITFGMLFMGFAGVFGILSYFSSLAGRLPLVGRFVKDGIGFVLGLVTLGLATATFALEWVIIALVKNIWIVIGILALAAIATAVYMATRKD